MSDPWRIFKDDPGRQNTLKMLWPDLYECLAQLDGSGPARVIKCALTPCVDVPLGTRPPAVARLFEYGPPGCERHVKTLADRPGGWPLRRERVVR